MVVVTLSSICEPAHALQHSYQRTSIRRRKETKSGRVATHHSLLKCSPHIGTAPPPHTHTGLHLETRHPHPPAHPPTHQSTHPRAAPPPPHTHTNTHQASPIHSTIPPTHPGTAPPPALASPRNSTPACLLLASSCTLLSTSSADCSVFVLT
jgi:hypothetical protein